MTSLSDAIIAWESTKGSDAKPIIASNVLTLVTDLLIALTDMRETAGDVERRAIWRLSALFLSTSETSTIDKMSRARWIDT